MVVAPIFDQVDVNIASTSHVPIPTHAIFSHLGVTVRHKRNMPTNRNRLGPYEVMSNSKQTALLRVMDICESGIARIILSNDSVGLIRGVAAEALRLQKDNARSQITDRPPTQPHGQAEPQTEPQTELQTEPQTEPQTELQTELQTDPQTEPQTDPQVRPRPRRQSRARRQAPATTPEPTPIASASVPASSTYPPAYPPASAPASTLPSTPVATSTAAHMPSPALAGPASRLAEVTAQISAQIASQAVDQVIRRQVLARSLELLSPNITPTDAIVPVSVTMVQTNPRVTVLAIAPSPVQPQPVQPQPVQSQHEPEHRPQAQAQAQLKAQAQPELEPQAQPEPEPEPEPEPQSQSQSQSHPQNQQSPNEDIIAPTAPRIFEEDEDMIDDIPAIESNVLFRQLGISRQLHYSDDMPTDTERLLYFNALTVSQQSALTKIVRACLSGISNLLLPNDSPSVLDAFIERKLRDFEPTPSPSPEPTPVSIKTAPDTAHSVASDQLDVLASDQLDAIAIDKESGENSDFLSIVRRLGVDLPFDWIIKLNESNKGKKFMQLPKKARNDMFKILDTCISHVAQWLYPPDPEGLLMEYKEKRSGEIELRTTLAEGLKKAKSVNKNSIETRTLMAALCTTSSMESVNKLLNDDDEITELVKKRIGSGENMTNPGVTPLEIGGTATNGIILQQPSSTLLIGATTVPVIAVRPLVYASSSNQMNISGFPSNSLSSGQEASNPTPMNNQMGQQQHVPLTNAVVVSNMIQQDNGTDEIQPVYPINSVAAGIGIGSVGVAVTGTDTAGDVGEIQPVYFRNDAGNTLSSGTRVMVPSNSNGIVGGAHHIDNLIKSQVEEEKQKRYDRARADWDYLLKNKSLPPLSTRSKSKKRRR